MKLRKLKVQGFKSLDELCIHFDDALTVVVGENDAGKTSLIECLKVITQGRPVGPDDFTHGRNTIVISVEIDDFVFRREYRKSDSNVEEEPMQAHPTDAYIERTLKRLRGADFDLTHEVNQSFVREIAGIFGLTVRSNSVIANLREQLIERLTADGDHAIEGAKFPRFNNIQLDGKHFENVSAFFKEVFLKEKQASIWKEEIYKGTSIEEFVRSHLEKYSSEVSMQIRGVGIIDKLKIFLPELTDVRVEPVFHARDLNVDAKVKFLENGGEILIDNKGDGTKRRMTMALLEFKKEQSRIPNDEQTIYLLDEPDTHLHVRAQLELVETVQSFSDAGNQVILTTHSPFIVNAVKPNQVRLLVRENGKTSLKGLSADPHNASRILRALGVENTHLFFSRKIVIVEGQTEEAFLPHQYFKKTNHTISSGLVKIINVNGVSNIVGFSRAILELHDPLRIFILCDNDSSPELQELIDAIGIPSANKFQVGSREFEDAFESDVLQRVWAKYHEDSGRKAPDTWTVEAINELKTVCLRDGCKFSERIRSLNQGGKKMTKPIFGAALGQFAEENELPQRLQELLTALVS